MCDCFHASHKFFPQTFFIECGSKHHIGKVCAVHSVSIEELMLSSVRCPPTCL
ncbi:hypothetical protein GDO78_020392 [Eleutherodactylus coqui]|uniref:Uncharacterized protein n=1 Tax=Eleutherodactylus coqui TaxID=57060 RepID=A0A8J6BID7_ELECQ|nr:hypothetical protein GDO78_020392 [Eleutherodactylus coqui]